jgi:methylenetetrahydrofolate dehydrogenase (NADP+)/methenyltetrahydrofolate cyclohydrolase
LSAQIIDGKAIALKVRAAAAEKVKSLRAAPGLAVVLVGDDPASQIYVRGKTKACAEAGVRTFDHRLPATISERELLTLVSRLSVDDAVHGILVQLPLPPHINAERVISAISPLKDVDGFSPLSVGSLWRGVPTFVPCTPAGIMVLLKEAGVSLRGADAVVIGRSNIVGKPTAALLMAADATVTVCHSKTRDLPERVGRADVVVAAIGKSEFVKGSWIKPGAVVIDVGMNRGPDGKLKGDVEFAAAAKRARAITPVPGGVGPMTIAMLVQSTVDAASRSSR